jgi:DNA-binding transcriptional LysR family regulator
MVEFKALHTFACVADLGSFRGAARRLHMTQPAVSQRIGQLEAELGTRLLERKKRAVTLTATGRELLGYAEKLLRLRGEMLSALSEKAAVRGVLRLGVSETIVHTWLPRFIERLDARYPHLGLEIEVDTSPNLRERLLGRQIDLAFMLGPLAAPAIRNLPLCRYAVAFVASTALKWPRKTVALADLAAWPIITFSKNTQPYVEVRELFNRPDLPPVRLHASASLSTVVRLALDGLGVAVIPPAIVRAELAAKTLRVIDVGEKIPDLNFEACWPTNVDSPAAEAVAAIAAEIAAERPRARRGRATS